MDKLLTVSEIAETLGVAARTIRDWAQAQKIGYYKVGKELRFTKKDLDIFMASRRVEARPRLRRAG